VCFHAVGWVKNPAVKNVTLSQSFSGNWPDLKKIQNIKLVKQGVALTGRNTRAIIGLEAA